LPNVPVSKGVVSVSPSVTVIDSSNTPSSSAAIMASTVPSPAPISATPTRQSTLPSPMISISAVPGSEPQVNPVPWKPAQMPTPRRLEGLSGWASSGRTPFAQPNRSAAASTHSRTVASRKVPWVLVASPVLTRFFRRSSSGSMPRAAAISSV
jgi:hypothetical protein